MVPRKIFLQTLGSRGDVQPYIPIALAIRDAGFDICIASNVGHRAFVEECGLKFYGPWIDSEKFMKENETCKKAMAEGSLTDFMKCLGEAGEQYAKESTEKWKQAMDEFKPDLVISGTLAEMCGRIAAYKMGLPVIEVKLQAYPPNPKPAPMGIPDLPFGLNGWVWKNIVLGQLWKSWMASNDAIEEVLGYKFTDVFSKQMMLDDHVAPDMQPIPLLIAQANIFTGIIFPNLPNIYKCIGHSFIKSEVQVDLARKGGNFGDAQGLDALSAFLAAGSRPVYMGWGSMICRSPEYMVVCVSRALKHSGLRGIIQGGWAHLDLDMLKRVTKDDALIKYMEENALFIDKAPHEWLFPQCAFTVHHGGSGTFGCSARAGVPMIITPVFLDQFDHAYLVNRLGFGIGFKKQFQKIKPEELGEAMKDVVSNADMAKKAIEVGRSMHAEDAPAAVVEYISEFWTTRVESGKFKAGIKARQSKPKARCVPCK